MIIVLIGPPGSGKGTVAQLLAKKGWVHFSMGQALRDHVKRKGPLAQKIDSIISKGNLVPGKIFFKVFFESINRLKKKNVVLDGLPRTLDQARELKKLQKKMQPISAYFFLDAEEKEVRDRLSKRRQCEKCGKVFGKVLKPPKSGRCDRCGGKLTTRTDDKPSVIHDRFIEYRTKTEPVIEWAAGNYPMFYINGHGHPSVVFKRIQRIVSLIQKGE